MNYALLIEERRSVRSYQEKPVPPETLRAVRAYHESGCMRLIPELETELVVANTNAREALEKAAGYYEFLIGAPAYLVLLSEAHEHMLLNAGYIMEDLSLKLNELGCGACFLTFRDGDAVKSALAIASEKQVVAILAFGLPVRVRKKLHLNVETLSKISVTDKQHYFDPKKKVAELVYLDRYRNTEGVAERIDYYGGILWDAFHAAANAPSYLNRQPYAFIMKDKRIHLISEPDELTNPADCALNLGIVMQHFAAVAQPHISTLKWEITSAGDLSLPEGCTHVAFCEV